MSKANEAEVANFLTMLLTPVGIIVTLVFLCIYVSNRFFKRKGRK